MTCRNDKKLVLFLALCIVCSVFLFVPMHAEDIKWYERTISINEDWKFYQGDAGIDASKQTYDDSSWQSINVPHDWEIFTDYSIEGEAESGFRVGGIGWYRKTLVIPEEVNDKRITLHFNGVYMHATIYVNGNELGYHPYGYTPFSFDITNDVVCDGTTKNVIAVKVDNSDFSSRWYTGSGIYRNVTLEFTNPIHIKDNGVTITYPNLENQFQDVVTTKVETILKNESVTDTNLEIRSTIMDGNQIVSGPTTIVMNLLAKDESAVTQSIDVQHPNLWSFDNPHVYTLLTEIYEGGICIDTVTNTFGYRYTSFDADQGFSLNGNKTKLKGVCIHHDLGALGTAENKMALQKRLQLLKDMGANAIRVAHNPASDTLLELCDTMGFLVIEEFADTWTNAKNFNFSDYSKYFNEKIAATNTIQNGSEDMSWAEFDVKAMVLRSRNHPCILAWSIGNELLGNIGGDTSQYPQLARDIIHWIETIDTTHPVTIANIIRPDVIQDGMEEAVAGSNGFIGYNYATGDFFDEKHALHPERVLLASETASTLGSRGYYQKRDIDWTTCQIGAYDQNYPEWGSSAQTVWQDVITRDYLMGEFVWIGFDYLGEPTPWEKESGSVLAQTEAQPRSSYFGLIDLAGIPKDVYYYYQSQWNDRVHTLHVLPSWNKDAIAVDENGVVMVTVYSDAPHVELFLNGNSLGVQSYEQFETEGGYTYQLCEGRSSYRWYVPYEEGLLQAVAYDQDMQAIEHTQGRNLVQTSSEPAYIALCTDNETIEANGNDLVYIVASVMDKDGIAVPNANHAIQFEVEGNGRLLATDNGLQTDLSSFQSPTKNAYNGKVVAIVQSTKDAGAFTVKVSSEELTGADITIITTPIIEPEEPEIIEPTPEPITTFSEFIEKYPMVAVLWVVFVVLLIMFMIQYRRINRRR